MNKESLSDWNVPKMNKEFYTDCAVYFESLLKSNKIDQGFEDEFFFTMPSISNPIQQQVT